MIGEIHCTAHTALFGTIKSSAASLSYATGLTRKPNRRRVRKAYAKLHGCYESLQDGHIEYSLQDVTGSASMKLRLTEPKFAAQVESGAMWQMLKAYHSEDQLLAFSRSRSSNPRAQEGGLPGGHAYPVVDVCELHADATPDLEALDVQLVRLVDRWGIMGGGWEGDWSSGSGMWEDYPDIKKIVDKKGDIEHSFWMSWPDLVKNFNQLFVGYSLETVASSVLYNGAWILGDVKSGAGGNPTNESFPQNPQYAFAVNEPTKVVVTLNQTDIMFTKGLLYDKLYSEALGFCIMKITGTKSRSTKFHAMKLVGGSCIFAKTRSVSGILDLLPGRYAIIPCTVQHDKEGDFTLEVSSNLPVTFENTGNKMAEADDEESDDEALGASELEEWALSANEDNEVEEDDNTRGLQSLMLMVGDLASYVRDVGADIKNLEGHCTELEEKINAANLP